ncbi:hypothetical protein B0H66DRAFT_39724 [Apodospora peruviana]|uniref:Uncharacterized protein n=1 Tax=Apodospora peruviana TaxID=516989 RepID=A0AAE0IRA2_9PEZI|nr:hypothetical protein B0H66DRAFT_39724 [Apodospora peruviana]
MAAVMLPEPLQFPSLDAATTESDLDVFKTSILQNISWQPLLSVSTHSQSKAGSSPHSTHLVMVLETERELSKPFKPMPPSCETRTPFIFIPRCKLDISPCEGLSSSSDDKLESVALPGQFVRAFLSSLGLSLGRDVNVIAHADDDRSWTYSRCQMTDFSSFSQDEATVLSNQGRLGCWATVLLTRLDGEARGDVSRWDLRFMIQRVVVC